MLTYNETKELINSLGRGEIESIIKRYGVEMVKAAVEVEISPSYIEDAFVGVFESKVEFAQEQVSDITDEIAKKHWYIKIDWEETANRIMEDYDEENNFYFKRM